MEDAQIGWVGAIIIGGIAGWLAEVITRSNMGIITNVILGIIGAGFASWCSASLEYRLVDRTGLAISLPVLWAPAS